MTEEETNLDEYSRRLDNVPPASFGSIALESPKDVDGREKFEVGVDYRTRGGWKARVVWISGVGWTRSMWVVHKPGGGDESVPISHKLCDGEAITVFSVNEAPVYGKHPADLIERWEEKEDARREHTETR